MTHVDWMLHGAGAQVRAAHAADERRILDEGDQELAHHLQTQRATMATIDTDVARTLDAVNGIVAALAEAKQRHETALHAQRQAEAAGKRAEGVIRRRVALSLETLRNQHRRRLDEAWRASQRAPLEEGAG